MHWYFTKFCLICHKEKENTKCISGGIAGTDSHAHFQHGDSFFFYFTYEPSAGRDFSRMSTLFEARARKERVLHLRGVQYF
jgi:hypothetical protein